MSACWDCRERNLDLFPWLVPQGEDTRISHSAVPGRPGQAWAGLGRHGRAAANESSARPKTKEERLRAEREIWRTTTDRYKGLFINHYQIRSGPFRNLGASRENEESKTRGVNEGNEFAMLSLATSVELPVDL